MKEKQLDISGISGFIDHTNIVKKTATQIELRAEKDKTVKP